MILLTDFYLDPDPARRAELLECTARNTANPLIDEIHLFVAGNSIAEAARSADSRLRGDKLRWNEFGPRPTYQDLFAYANRALHGQRVIIANADIYFDDTLRRLDGYDLTGRLLCLSRWDVCDDEGGATLFEQPASQDAWIFEAPVTSPRCNFHLGVLGCDNRLAWEAEQVGLRLSNPSRSIRAYHLHRSQVRRYAPNVWLPGPTRSVPATFLGTPWLWFVVPCMDRLTDVQRTAGTLLTQPSSSYVLVDYASRDGAGDWARLQHPEITVLRVLHRLTFHGAEARNRGAGAVDDDGIICFLDADVCAGPGFAEFVLTTLEPGSFLAAASGRGLDSVLACWKSDFDRAGGFDEAFREWGDECADFCSTLRSAGLTEHTVAEGQLHGAPSRRNGEARYGIHAAYRQAKSEILRQTGGRPISLRARREIYTAIAQQHQSTGVPPDDAWLARLAFRERMGYSIATLETGVSSHNNVWRPFTNIPLELVGLPFTQVVASSVSTIEVELLTSGKLFVLVGTDWGGYEPATEWLRQTGVREALPLVRTNSDTSFEVWSFSGEAGDCYILPTQIMLVARELVRR